jgi:hypothetical protein
VRATDAAGNLSPYSNTASATAALSVTPRVAVITPIQSQQFTANSSGVTWSVNGVVGGSASVGTITSGGLYTPPAVVGSFTVQATTTAPVQSASATVFVTDYAGTFTHHNDNLRTGQNLHETVLSASNVTSTQFGQLFSYTLDGVPQASPLYVANVNVPGFGSRNVVYVATEHDSVYAFDADGLTSTALWHVSFVNPTAGITTVSPSDVGEPGDIAPEIGITGTPVIDPSTGTLYVVAKTKEVSGTSTNFVQRLHALDIATGSEKFGGPIVLQATVPGTGDGNDGAGHVPFNSLRENQRAALLLNNGTVYIAFGSHGDVSPYHGWVLAYDAQTLGQVFAFNDTPNGGLAGIWQGGAGPGADANGNVYFASGNGTFDANTGGADYGDSFTRLHPTTGAVVDYFTPHDQSTLDSMDLDLGSAGTLLLPDQPGLHPHLILGAGKNGTIYVVDRDNMGHFRSGNDNQIVQSLINVFPSGSQAGNYSAPVYFQAASGAQYMYFGPVRGTIQTFQVTNGLLSTAPVSHSAIIYDYPGATLAISADGTAHPILWALERPGGYSTSLPGVLHAYDATDLSTELYSGSLGDVAVKFTIPTVANGRVYVGSQGQLTAFGLLP